MLVLVLDGLVLVLVFEVKSLKMSCYAMLFC